MKVSDMWEKSVLIHEGYEHLSPYTSIKFKITKMKVTHNLLHGIISHLKCAVCVCVVCGAGFLL